MATATAMPVTGDIPLAAYVSAVPQAPAAQAAHGMQAPPARSNSVSEVERNTFLTNLDVTPGIKRELLRSLNDFPLRIWIIDNSGSMSTSDGHVIINSGAGRCGMVACSRWEELGQSLLWHAEFAAHMGAPTEFRMLNPPGGGQPQVLQVGVGGVQAAEAEVRSVASMIQQGPTGRTPLCAQIQAVVMRIRQQEQALRQSGQKVLVVIASDGAATDGDVERALRPLRSLPVWLVVRLCTDDDSVVDYWNKIDEELELDMDVLDDHSGEAAEVCEENPWLNYGAALHKLREWGTCNKLFDAMDERPFNVVEMHKLVKLILGGRADDLPHPQLGWSAFENHLKDLMKSEKKIFDPLRKRLRPWIDMRKLKRHYKSQCKKKGGCAVM